MGCYSWGMCPIYKAAYWLLYQSVHHILFVPPHIGCLSLTKDVCPSLGHGGHCGHGGHGTMSYSECVPDWTGVTVQKYN